ncbi:hypothetical protein JYK02_36620 [Corallococcus macrosporus]|uniref:Hyalin n=1 Tax=Corallococcus macrosporus TaxID=35 RepID=A0ABS3DNY9_9BACT|nr:hypothetical protein [Corallococcus macrosporus]
MTEAEVPLAAPFLLKDVVQGLTREGPRMGPTDFVELGTARYFTMDDGIHGRELWKTDGTPEGTSLVTDLLPGSLGSKPGSLVRMGDRLYFVARTLVDPSDPGKYGAAGDLYGLWRTDGTAQGTERLAALGNSALFLTEHQGVLYFAAPTVDDFYRFKLWRSDGTPEGTRMLWPDAFSVGSAHAWLGDSLYVVGSDATNEGGLWKTDGTRFPVRVAGGAGAQGPSDVRNLTALGDRLLFWARSTPDGAPFLWTSDGTPGGTAVLKLILPDTSSDTRYASYSSPFVVAGDTAFFSAWDSEGGQELWRTDGTAEGTVRVADIRPGIAGSLVSRITVQEGTVYFQALADGLNHSVWRSDGTAEGTVRVAPFQVGEEAQLRSWAAPRTGPQGVFFSVWTQADGNRLWRTDGTAPGTVPVTAEPTLANIDLVGGGAGQLYFTSTKGTLWSTDGTPDGTRALRKFDAALAGAFDGDWNETVDLGGTLYFTLPQVIEPGPPYRMETVIALWRTDGTPGGTRQVNRKAPGVFEHEPLHLTPLNGHLLFVDERDRKTLWSMDARTEEVRPLSDFPSGVYGPPLAVMGAQAFFVRTLSASQQELWKTDGTPEGTVRVMGTPPGSPRGWSPHLLTPVGETLYFAARDDAELRDSLWKTDGTAAGTVRLKSFAGGPTWVDLLGIYPVGSRVYFRARQAESHQLWVTDGTAAGSRLVAELSGDDLRDPSKGEWAAVGDTLYLSLGSTSGEAPTLWKTDGKTSGVVRALPKTDVTAPPARLTAAGNQLLFWWTDGANGYELWKSDGTEAGTGPVKELRPGAAGSVAVPGPLVPLGPKGPWVFAASDGVMGVELWRTDGTAEGTRPLVDVLPGPLSSSPANLKVVGDRLFFSAWTPETGREPWVLPLK